MDAAWTALVCNWATDRGLCRTATVIALSGTRAWMKARQMFLAGEPAAAVRAMLDKSTEPAMCKTGKKKGKRKGGKKGR